MLEFVDSDTLLYFVQDKNNFINPLLQVGSGYGSVEKNHREQYSRSWSLRISGLQVPREEIERLGRDRGVMKYVYDRLLKPILNAAKAKGDIETVPGAYHLLLENGHHVFTRQGRQGGVRGGEGGATAEGEGRAHQIPQIIVRFCSRYMRNVVLRNKKASTPVNRGIT